jgi:hypothetical protein
MRRQQSLGVGRAGHGHIGVAPAVRALQPLGLEDVPMMLPDRPIAASRASMRDAQIGGWRREGARGKCGRAATGV